MEQRRIDINEMSRRLGSSAEVEIMTANATRVRSVPHLEFISGA